MKQLLLFSREEVTALRNGELFTIQLGGSELMIQMERAAPRKEADKPRTAVKRKAVEMFRCDCGRDFDSKQARSMHQYRAKHGKWAGKRRRAL